MSTAQSNSVVLSDIFELYKQETAAAGNDPAKHAAAQERLYKSLRNAGVNEKIVEAVETLVTALPDNEVKVAEALRQAAQGKVQRLQELQTEQARMLMNLHARPEQAKVAIASFATTLSTIFRFFGADDIAEAIEEKTQEVMATVNIPLNTSNVTAGTDVLNQAKGTVIGGLLSTNALSNMGTMGNAQPNVTASTPAQNYPNHTKTTWEKYQDAFREMGLSQTEIDKLKAPWSRTSKLMGNIEVIENGAEMTTFLASPEVQGLGAQKTQDLTKKLEQLARELT